MSPIAHSNDSNVKWRRPKLALIGSGAIGGTMALFTGLKHLGDVVLFDVVKDMPAGKALDLSQTCPILGCEIKYAGVNSYEGIADSDVVIITAGLTKAPSKSDAEWNRDDLLPFNAKIMRQVGENIKIYCPNAFVICITNPLDCMVSVLHKASGVPPHMICGMAGVLDSSRFRQFIADKLNVSCGDVQGLVVGTHGESMLPLPRYCSVNGIPLADFVDTGQITEQDIKDIVERTTNGGKEVMTLLGQGSAFYAPAAAAIEMAAAYIRDEKRVLVCATYLDKGEYGVTESGLFVGIPVVIGGGGIEKKLKINLREDEQLKFLSSTESVRRLNQRLVEMETLASTSEST